MSKKTLAAVLSGYAMAAPIGWVLRDYHGKASIYPVAAISLALLSISYWIDTQAGDGE